jgi:hypothetical protein
VSQVCVPHPPPPGAPVPAGARGASPDTGPSASLGGPRRPSRGRAAAPAAPGPVPGGPACISACCRGRGLGDGILFCERSATRERTPRGRTAAQQLGRTWPRLPRILLERLLQHHRLRLLPCNGPSVLLSMGHTNDGVKHARCPHTGRVGERWLLNPGSNKTPANRTTPHHGRMAWPNVPHVRGRSGMVESGCCWEHAAPRQDQGTRGAQGHRGTCAAVCGVERQPKRGACPCPICTQAHPTACDSKDPAQPGQPESAGHRPCRSFDRETGPCHPTEQSRAANQARPRYFLSFGTAAAIASSTAAPSAVARSGENWVSLRRRKRLMGGGAAASWAPRPGALSPQLPRRGAAEQGVRAAQRRSARASARDGDALWARAGDRAAAGRWRGRGLRPLVGALCDVVHGHLQGGAERLRGKEEEWRRRGGRGLRKEASTLRRSSTLRRYEMSRSRP